MLAFQGKNVSFKDLIFIMTLFTFEFKVNREYFFQRGKHLRTGNSSQN